MTAEHPNDAEATPPGLDTQHLMHRLQSRLFEGSEVETPMLGRFTIIGRLGQGGMGTVFSAYDPHLDRKVALKVLRRQSGGDGSDGQARLLREAQSLAKLSHPNVVSIHEVGTVDAQVFIALEYVSGGSLAEVEGADFDLLLDQLVQAGRGLEAAHQRGLVHRDVKPANILLTGDGRAKVSDFGLATEPREGVTLEQTLDGLSEDSHRTSADPELAPHLEQAGILQTKTGAFVGTPAFMAPEQLDGAPVDARTDQFAFCVTAYRVLEGRPPFPGQTLVALRESIEQGPLPAKHVPSWLERIVARGLARDPDARYPSMRALLDAIELARKPRDWKRLTLVIGAVGIAGGAWAFAAGGGPVDPCDGIQDALGEAWDDAGRARGREAFVATEQPFAADAWDRTEDSVDGYVAAWTSGARASCEQTFHAGTQSDEAHDLRMGCLEGARLELAALVELLGQADAKMVARAEALVPSLPDLRACELIEELRAVGVAPDDPKVGIAREQIARARSAIAAGRMSEANEAARLATEAADDAAWDPARAEALLALGKTEQELGRLTEGEERLRMAIDLAESSRADRVLAEAWIELLSNVVDFQARPEPLETISRRAQSAVHRIDDPPMMKVRLLTTLGRAKEVAGDYVGARADLEDAMNLVASTDDVPATVRITTLHQLGGVLSLMGEPEKAVSLRKEALELAKGSLGDRHPTVAKLLSSLAVDYMEIPDNEQALALFDASIELRDELQMPAAAPYGNRGQLLVLMGRPLDAVPDFERAIEVFTKTVGPDHPTIGMFLLQKATVYLSLGDNDTAKDLLEQADAKLAKHLPPSHPNRLAATINLASVLIAQGEADEALQRVMEAREAMRVQSKPCSQVLMSTTEIAAQAQVALGRPARGLEEYDSILKCWQQRPPDAVDREPAVKWGKAKALRALGREPEARTLAQQALKTYGSLGEHYTAEVAAVREWLRGP